MIEKIAGMALTEAPFSPFLCNNIVETVTEMDLQASEAK